MEESLSVGTILADPFGKKKSKKVSTTVRSKITPDQIAQGMKLHPVTDRPYMPKKKKEDKKREKEKTYASNL